MHGNVSSDRNPAISADGKSVIESSGDGAAEPDPSSDDISVAPDENWFAEMAQALLVPKPGTALHYITGFDERSCQRYAAGSVKPPAYFIRALLRSEQGGPILAALMDGCTARWWVDFQRYQRMGLAAETAR